MKKKLLLNWLYKKPVGHVAEALKLSYGYFLANKDLDIYLILNAEAPTELVEGCSWIKGVYPVSPKEVKEHGIQAGSIQRIPKEWDYIITDKRSKSIEQPGKISDLENAHKILNEILVATVAKGYVEQIDNHEEGVLPCVVNPKVTLEIPKEARDFVLQFKHSTPTISIMLGGSKGLRQSPTREMWLKICQALVVSIPNLKIYFTGVSVSTDGKTFTKDFTLEDVDYLISQLPNAERIYDVGLWNQIAFIATCDIFLSPHTGFAFIPPLVGTPWLEIATCRWPAYFFNDMPFYSVLPKCRSYPSLDDRDKECDALLRANSRVVCVSDELVEQKIPEIVEGARLLLDKDFTYEKAMALHLSKIEKEYDRDRFFFFGGIEDGSHK